jgi:5,5'-dehydrodivanillate O-demethylase
MAVRGRAREAGGFGRPFHAYGFQWFPWGMVKNWSYGGEKSGSWWGNLLVFPNMLRLENSMHWRLPIDDTHTKIIRVEFVPNPDGSRSEISDPRTEEPEVVYEPTWINEAGEYHQDTFSSQDGMAWETQGPIFDRTREHLGQGDTGVAMLRQVLSDQIDAVARGDDPICLIRDPDQNHGVDLASWLREAPPDRGGVGGIGQVAPADVRRRTFEETFDESYREFEIAPGAARAGVFEHLANLKR